MAVRTDPFQNIVDLSSRQPDKLSPVIVGIEISFGISHTPDPTAFCNGTANPGDRPGPAICSINHPEGWPPAPFDWCGPGQTYYTDKTSWSWGYVDPFTDARSEGRDSGPAGEGYGDLLGVALTSASGGTLSAAATMHMLGGSICGQFEFPGSYSNAVFWPYSGTVESPYAKSLPSTFTLTGLVKTVDGQQHPAISIYTVGATISAGNSGSSAISATFQYDPGPLIVVG